MIKPAYLLRKVVIPTLFFVFLFSCAPSPELMSPNNRQGDYAVVLHGIVRSNRNMRPIAKELVKMGYEVINIDYPSTDLPLEKLIDLVHLKLENYHLSKKPIHFVGYSMGALIVRGLIHRYRPESLGRVVLLAPPNHGSEVADSLKKNVLFRWIWGPAGQDLRTKQAHIEKLFGPVDFELGVLAGNRTLDPFCAWLIPGIDDGKVSVESTKLDGMKDHMVINATHTLFPSTFEVIGQTVYFLRHGEFRRKKK